MNQPVCLIHKFVERDIDMLLAEELRVNAPFAEWMMRRVGVEVDLTYPAIETRVSVVEDGSEADVVATFASGGGVHRLYIENKIDAVLMPEQLERYVRRAEAETARGDIGGWSLAFFTPAYYARAFLPHSVVQISFEEAAAALRSLRQGLRSEYRADFLERAAPRRTPAERDAHIAEVEPYVAEWWDAVYGMLDREFPGFFLPARTRYPRSVYFAPQTADMAGYLRIDFKGHKGEVDLAFKNVMADDLIAAVSGLDDVPGSIVANGKSSALQIRTDAPFRIADGTDIIDTKVRAAYQAASDLLTFWRRHRQRFDSLAKEPKEATRMTDSRSGSEAPADNTRSEL